MSGVEWVQLVCPWGVRYGVGWYVGVEWVDIQVWSGLICVGVHGVRCSVRISKILYPTGQGYN